MGKLLPFFYFFSSRVLFPLYLRGLSLIVPKALLPVQKYLLYLDTVQILTAVGRFARRYVKARELSVCCPAAQGLVSASGAEARLEWPHALAAQSLMPGLMH